jgi:nuclear pore complex protein Nup107
MPLLADNMAGSPGDYGEPVIHVDPEVEVFANALDDCLASSGTATDKRARILRLVGIYHECLTTRLESLRQTLPRNTSGSADENEMDLDDAEDRRDSADRDGEIQQVEQEARIWDLLRRLLPIRYPDSSPTSSAARPAQHPYGTNRLWRDFLQTEPTAVERTAVLEWLQDNAAYRPDIDDIVRDLQQNADRGDIIAHGWLHTRSAIKLRKSLQAWPRYVDHESPAIAQSLLNSDRAPLVTQLDPDSVTRQARRLEPQDEYFERSIWVGCYELLRRGSSLDGIREWCMERTEVWRAVSMSASPLIEHGDEESLGPDAASIALWRRMCFALAREGGTDDFERAVYGLLSGDLLSVEKVCRTWDDFAFANYNAILRSQFDTYVLSCCLPVISAGLSQSFPVFDSVQFHGDVATLERRLMTSLESNAKTRTEALNPMVSLQAAIISKDLDRHLYEQGFVLAQHANAKQQSKLIPDPEALGLDVDSRKFIDLGDHTGLRVMSHVFVIVSSLDNLSTGPVRNGGLDQGGRYQEMQENLIAAYVSYLRLARLEELIPLYCSKLRGPRRYHILSRNLIHVTDRDARLVQLALIHKAGLDPLEFAKLQPRLVFGDLSDGVRDLLRPAKGFFKIMEDGPQSIKYGRPIKADFFGEDPDLIDRGDELLIRSVEWMLLVDGAWRDIFDVGVQVYKYFLSKYCAMVAVVRCKLT